MMRTLNYSPLVNRQTYRGKRGGVITTLLAFLLGVVVGLGALFAGGYAFLTQLTIKDMVNTTSGMLDIKIDYSAYITEDYAQKTVFAALKDAASLVKDESFSMEDLDGVSPVVGDKVTSIADTLSKTTGIEIPVDGENGLMATPLRQLSAFFLDCVYDTDLGTLISSESFNLLDESNELYDILMLIAYGEKDVDYTIVDGNVVMAEGKVPAKVGSLIGAEGYEPVAFSDKFMRLKIGDLISVSEGETQPVLYNAIKDWSIGDLKNPAKINSLTLADILGQDAMDGNFILKNLSASTLDTIDEDIANLTVLQVFADQAYDEHNNLKGTWKYMLKDADGNVVDCKISEFDQLVSNMQRNVQSATLNDLDADGIAVFDEATLNTNIIYNLSIGSQQLINIAPADYNNKTTIGQMTIIELGGYLGEMIAALNSVGA